MPLMPADEIWGQLTSIRNDFLTKVHSPAERDALKMFHAVYYVPFWMKQIGPERISVFGCKDKTNNVLENRHRQMKKLLPTHPLFCNFVPALRQHIIYPEIVRLSQLNNGQDIGTTLNDDDLEAQR